MPIRSAVRNDPGAAPLARRHILQGRTYTRARGMLRQTRHGMHIINQNQLKLFGGPRPLLSPRPLAAGRGSIPSHTTRLSSPCHNPLIGRPPNATGAQLQRTAGATNPPSAQSFPNTARLLPRVLLNPHPPLLGSPVRARGGGRPYLTLAVFCFAAASEHEKVFCRA